MNKIFERITNLKIKIIATAVYILFLAVAYALKLPCLFLSVFHIPCCTCGMTRAWIAAFHLDFQTAFSYHPMFWTIPICYLFILFDGKLFKKNFVNILILVLIAFGFVATYTIKLTGNTVF